MCLGIIKLLIAVMACFEFYDDSLQVMDLVISFSKEALIK
jgi:hypothetical protein